MWWWWWCLVALSIFLFPSHICTFHELKILELMDDKITLRWSKKNLPRQLKSLGVVVQFPSFIMSHTIEVFKCWLDGWIFKTCPIGWFINQIIETLSWICQFWIPAKFSLKKIAPRNHGMKPFHREFYSIEFWHSKSVPYFFRSEE